MLSSAHHMCSAALAELKLQKCRKEQGNAVLRAPEKRVVSRACCSQVLPFLVFDLGWALLEQTTDALEIKSLLVNL